VGDHHVAVDRRQLGDDLRHLGAVDQAAGLRDHAEQRRVGVQVAVPRLPRDAGVENGRSRLTGRVEDGPGDADDVAGRDLLGEEDTEGALGRDDVTLHVHGDHSGGAGVEVHCGRLLR
jgi:hypothetical protein